MTIARSGHGTRRRGRRAGVAVFSAVSMAMTVGSVAFAAAAVAAPSPTAAVFSATAVAARTPAGSSLGGARQVVQAKPALPTGTRSVNAVAASMPVHGAVALRPRDAAGLATYATAVSTPGSPLFHHYLAPGAFASTFGPTASSVDGVEAELRAAGLRVAGVSSNRLLVDFTGRARALEAAFGTHLESYRLAGGRLVTATTSAVTFPASLAPAVQAVVGLSDVIKAQPEGLSTAKVRHHQGSYPKAVAPADASQSSGGGPVACAAATAAAKESGGLTDTQIANAYGLNGLYSAGDTGVGQTVAIFELEPYARSDIATFDQCFFGANAAASMMSRLKTVAVDGGEPTGFGSGEASLDIQGVSALAPGANIDVYEAPNSEFGSLDEYNTMVETDAAKVISTSWGFCELALQDVNPGTQQLENTIFEQAAAQGQSIFAASGDDGSDDCAESGPQPVMPLLSVDDPGSQPFVMSAGGTTTTDATLPPKEKVWNDGANGGGGGGGISSTWAEPTWQAAATVPGINAQSIITEAEQRAGDSFCQTMASGATACREVPDVSANADENTGAITFYSAGQWGTVGGTSAAAPIWAGVLAEINASAACVVAGGVGFANPELYAVASVPAEYAASFTDVTSGTNDSIGVDGGLFPATPGYDMASGLGTPQVTGPGDSPGLASYLCAMATPSGGGSGGRPAVTAVAPPVVSGAGGAQVTVTGHGFESASVSVVSGVQIGTYKVPAAYVDVTSATTITLTVPSSSVLAGAAGNSPLNGNGTYDVVVSVDSGQSSAPSAASRLTVTNPQAAAGQPEVDGVGPSGGNEAGGATVTVYGSGLTGADAVTFGGVAATDVAVVSESQLTVKVPAYSPGTACANATDPTDDVCQVQVRVTTPAGTSPAGSILRPLTGPYLIGPLEIPELPANCNCELAPSPTEYDYLPTPTITSITSRPAGADGNHYASEAGTTIETINGRGLGILGLEWIDVGPPSEYFSSDFSFTEVSGTQTKVLLPPIQPATTVTPVPLWVQTLASPNSADVASTTINPSNTKHVLYAPAPLVSSVSAGRFDAGPTKGGTKLTVHGVGLAAAGRLVLIDRARGGITARTTAIHVVSNDEVTLDTPPAPAGRDQVQICDATGCSSPRLDRNPFTYFPPGDPTVSSVRPRSGAVGGTVTVTGHNLGFLQAVYFGTTKTTAFKSSGSPSDVGSTTTFAVRVPPGRLGTRVNIRVVTLESEATKKYPKSPVNPDVTFTYTR